MKTIATFVTLAALASGVSFAQAQGTLNQPGASGGANARYCLDIRGSKTCTFQTLAACQQAAGASGTCAPNPNFAAKSGSDAMKSRAMEPKNNPGTTGSSPTR